MMAAATLVLLLPLSAGSAEKPKISVETDLPPFSYSMPLTAQRLLASDSATFNAFAARVNRDLEAIFRNYEVDDKGVLVHLLSDQVDLHMLFRRDAEALATCERVRDLIDRPDFKATGMFNDLSFIRARMATGRSDGEVFQAEYKRDFALLVDSLSWDVVADRVKKTVKKFERLSTGYVEQQVENEIEPYVKEHHALDFRLATKLVFWRGTLMTEVPQRQIVLDVLSAYIQEHEAASVPALRPMP
jgi:hypothetical protein